MRFLRPGALRSALPFGVVALCALTLSACNEQNGGTGATVDVTVMTRNLYLGADLFALANPNDPTPIPVRVAQLYATVQASNPAERMAAVAAEIAAHDPDLVGLQEVVTYRFQAVSDYDPANPVANAEVVTYDFLQLLLAALAARGESYTVVATNANSDVELPGTMDGTSFFDVRLTDTDVVLARQGVTVSGATATRFGVAAPVPVGGTTINFYRGYTRMNATVDGVSFTFANTHLEVGGAAVQAQAAQGVEFKGALAGVSGPVIVTGDFNSDPTDPGDDGGTYRLLTGGNGAFTDAGAGTGATCCQAADLRNVASTLDERIDLVLVRGAVSTLNAVVVGEEAGDRTPGGLWPSDHAGVVATLRVTN